LLSIVFACSLVAASGCYSRPDIPADKPLSCEGTDAAADCPVGFTCIMRVCAPRSCEDDQDCPAGLVCDPMRGCGRPGSDGGTDGGPVPDGGPPSGPGPDAAPAATFDAPVFDTSVGLSDGGVP
jgi:hypothetical protein